MKIFIQIASYRDPELVPTIKDCINRAKYPENLVFSIARQFNPEDKFDDLSEYDNDERFKILNIPYEESQGVCWARNLTQQLYDGEEYTMQIDSHMRFQQDWDEILINMVKDLQSSGVSKPLITSYVPSYDPKNEPSGRVNTPWRMDFDRFIPEGAIFFLPAYMNEWKELKSPIRARFYSAHFCFTLGQFAVEVQHNPEYYFHGEEISIAVRSFTWGYDLFHPHVIVCWHEYTRNGRTKQWDDDKTWGEKNNKSHLLNRKLFGMDGLEQEGHDGPYGFGPYRTLRDYEIYAGILFSKRSVQQYTLDRNEPPNPYNFEDEESWLKSFTSVFKHCIDVDRNLLTLTDYDFWVVAFHDEEGKDLYRQDADINEINSALRTGDSFIKIWRTFNTEKKPSKWIVWPHSSSKGWCDKIEGNL